ncbi:MAG: alpha-ketoglutarate-dependent dioxygenase AlkB [Candidatus Binatia bacterium]
MGSSGIVRRDGMPRGRVRGVPTVLPPPAAGAGRQLSLLASAAARSRCELLPGVVHVSGWLDHAAQRELVRQFRGWAAPPAGLRHPRMPTGHLMSVQSVCLGWHWSPYVYSRTADDTDGAPVKPLSAAMVALARDAVDAAYGRGQAAAIGFRPDAAIVNLYAPGARLGLHQDGEEPSEAPVVTIAIGDRCCFRLAGVERRSAPFTDVEMRSGDLIVFGGPSRRIFHGVPRVDSGTAPDGLGLPPGRLSITIRETGLE